MDVQLGEYINGKPYMKSDFLAVDKELGSSINFGAKLKESFNDIGKFSHSTYIINNGTKLRLDTYEVTMNFSNVPSKRIYFTRV